MMSETKRIADRFHVIEDPRGRDFLGQGGMGTVYRGIDIFTQEQVAVKVLKPEVIVKDPEIVTRFQREGEALRQLNHPNIVKMLGTENCDDGHYLVMEYVAGGSLRDLLQEQPQLSIQRTLYIALDIADALTRAHRLNILHRDIKPGNVLLSEDGTPRLTDFGMARIGDVHVTQSGAIVGTLAYLSPEALQGDELDGRTDIWAFGVMLYEMLAGERPFPYAQPGQLVNAILTQPTPDLEAIRPDLPTSLVDLIYRMLEKDKHARIPSVRMVGAQIEAIMRGTTTSMQVVVSSDSSLVFGDVTPTPTPISSSEQVIVPNNLPSQPTPFVGRVKEIADISEMIRDPQRRLITLLGPGGMGKTRLSLAVAEKYLQDFRDGVFFVPLAPVENVDHVVPTIAEHIGFTFGGAENPLDQLLSYLHEKHMLLVMDNFEQLTAGANLLSDILANAPDVTLLVSSREKLRLRGEQIYEVQGMRLPDKSTPLDDLSQFPVIQLFMQSARRNAPDFELTEEDKAAVVRICELVQGLPLGVELAASWLEMMPPAEIVQEIEQSLDFLETDLRDVPERHRSMRAVFDYSWNLMLDDERDIFMKLSIFRGGFEREAAQKITGANLRMLNYLVNKSLLQRDPGGRYRLHKLLRQYAEERFKAHPDYDNCYAAHSLYYGEFMEKIQGAFNSKNELMAVRKIDSEIENLRVAWNWAIQHQKWDALDKVLHSMMLFFLAESMLQEADSMFCHLADDLAKNGMEGTSMYWRARVRQSWVTMRLGNYDTGWQFSSAAEAYFLERGNVAERAHALNMMSYARMLQGQLDESAEYARTASQLCREDLTAYYMAMGNLGYAEYLRGNLEEAKRIYEDINQTAIQDDYSPIGRAYGLNNLGEILRTMGDLGRARTLFEQAYDIFKEYRQQRGMAFTLNNIAGICYVQGEYESAKEMYIKAYQLNREIGDRHGIGHSLSALGNVALNENNLAESRQYFEQSLAMRRELGDMRGIADSLTDLGNVALNDGRYDDAITQYQESLNAYHEIGIKEGTGFAVSGMGIAHWLLNHADEAKRLLQEALQLSEEWGNPSVTVRSVVILGQIALKEQDYDMARGYIQRGIRLAHDIKAHLFMLIAVASQGMLEAETGDKVRALELLTLVSRQRLSFAEVMRPAIEAYMEALFNDLSEEHIRDATESSKVLVLENVIKGLLAEA